MNILLVTPPLTQLNCPYPATAYLSGFLKSKGYQVRQCDLGIELINLLFTRENLNKIFEKAEQSPTISKNIARIQSQKQQYLFTIDAVMRFLRGQDISLATRICNSDFLPKASRFDNIADMDWAFGHLGFTDMARHYATLYLEDITDLIKETINPYFELGRYAEHLGIYVPEFAPLEQAILKETNIVDNLMLQILEEQITRNQSSVVGFSIPFPGNLYGAVKCSLFIRNRYPSVTIVWGGGYVNTELRYMVDTKVFDYVDYILFDDGELPFLRLLQAKQGKDVELIRTKVLSGTDVKSNNWESRENIPFAETGIPDYAGLPLDKYISLIETANPMHKLWSDGRWNKLTLAHGCYWAKCAFCDTSLPYISCYEPGNAKLLVDRIESVIHQTGSTGFHFVDEAAPPKILREISEEIIKRGLVISWWTNVRFEKAFTRELCALMERAGCIAVSGGIEVASNRLLNLMNKGVTVEQAAQSAYNLTSQNIMVHAYLMYGFPSQTLQETIDGLEIVRQMFDLGLIQSAFWHRYAMTVHSPSGISPEKYGAKHDEFIKGSFANNEIPFHDHLQIDLDMIGEGLRRATFNYMHGLCIDRPLQKWFKSKMPASIIKKGYLEKILQP